MSRWWCDNRELRHVMMLCTHSLKLSTIITNSLKRNRLHPEGRLQVTQQAVNIQKGTIHFTQSEDALNSILLTVLEGGESSGLNSIRCRCDDDGAVAPVQSGVGVGLKVAYHIYRRCRDSGPRVRKGRIPTFSRTQVAKRKTNEKTQFFHHFLLPQGVSVISSKRPAWGTRRKSML